MNFTSKKTFNWFFSVQSWFVNNVNRNRVFFSLYFKLALNKSYPLNF